MPERLDRVHIVVAGQIVEITWHERDVLLEELAFAPHTRAVRQAFEAVGASRPVELDAEQQAALRQALDNWESPTLQPHGIAHLHSVLRAVAAGSGA